MREILCSSASPNASTGSIARSAELRRTCGAPCVPQCEALALGLNGRLIVHRDISLVLGNTDMTQLAQVWAARTAGAGAGGEAKDIFGAMLLEIPVFAGVYGVI
jgi:hypothetical protein